MTTVQKELRQIVYGLLKNSKIDILNVAYRYNKSPYKNQNWLKDVLFRDWGIEINQNKNYIHMRDIQKELLKVPFGQLLPYMEFIYKAVRRIIGEHIFTQKKYKQLQLAHFRFENYYKEIRTDDNLELLSWISSVDKDIYEAIASDDNWVNNFFTHIDKIKAAFRSLLLKCAEKSKYKLIETESIISLYQNIYKHLPEAEELQRTDDYLVKILNDIKSKPTKNYLTATPDINQDIGLSFLFKLNNLAKEIKMNFKFFED